MSLRGIATRIANARDGFVYDGHGLDLGSVLAAAESGRPITRRRGARAWPSAIEGLRATEATTRGHKELSAGAQKLIDRTPDFAFTAAGPVHVLRDWRHMPNIVSLWSDSAGQERSGRLFLRADQSAA